jgi:uncharacterized membrane protein
MASQRQRVSQRGGRARSGVLPSQARRPQRSDRNGRAPGTRPARVAGPARAAATTPLWLRLTTLGLSLAGLGVSVYLTIEHYTGSTTLACPATATLNCLKVTTSPEATILGIFPVAVLGLAFYAFMTAINTPWAWSWPLRPVWWLRLASVIVGIAFVLYLIYTELFTLNAICLWCTSVHVITFLLFALVVTQAAIWGPARGSTRTPGG